MRPVPNPEPCTCGGSGVCTVCVLNDLGMEAALLVSALDRLETIPADNRLHSVHADLLPLPTPRRSVR